MGEKMPARWTLRKTVEIDAAHYLPEHPGKCANLHGHRWKISVDVEVDELDDKGMVIDFGEVSSLVRKLDHNCLNDLGWDFSPTAENIARWLADAVAENITRVCMVAVTVEETPGSRVTYRR